MEISLNSRATTYSTLRQQIIDMSTHAPGGTLASSLDVMPLDFPIAGEEVRYTLEEWSSLDVAWPRYTENWKEDVNALQRKGGKAKGKGKAKGRGGAAAGKGKEWVPWAESLTRRTSRPCEISGPE